MKIAMIAAINNPIKMPFEGGVPTQVWWSAKKLMERGHEVTLFASGDSDPQFKVVPIVPKSLFTNKAFRHADGAGFQHKINRRLRGLRARMSYKKLIKLLSKKDAFDVIHNHALYETPLLDADQYAAPMVSTLHTPPFKEIAKGVKVAGKKGNVTFVSVSQSLAKVWQTYTPSDVIYNGVNIADWEFCAKPEPKTAIWFGRITPQKGTHLAIEAAIEAGYKLSVFGKIVDQAYYDEKIAPLIEDSTEVHYGGNLSHNELSAEIGKASVMINTPQWEEPFGLTFVEAMACGTPPVTFESGAAQEIITDETGVIVPKNDIEALAKALEIAAKLDRQKCRNHAEGAFSLDRMIDEYEALYGRVVSAA